MKISPESLRDLLYRKAQKNEILKTALILSKEKDKLHITDVELAKAAYVELNTLSKYKSGKRKVSLQDIIDTAIKLGVKAEYFDESKYQSIKRLYYDGEESDTKENKKKIKRLSENVLKQPFDDSVNVDTSDELFIQIGKDDREEVAEQAQLSKLDKELNTQLKELCDNLPLDLIQNIIENYDTYVRLADDAWWFILYYNYLYDDGRQIIRNELHKYMKLDNLKADVAQIKLCRNMQEKLKSKEKAAQDLDNSQRPILWDRLYKRFNASSYGDMENLVWRTPNITQMENEDWELLIDFFKLGIDKFAKNRQIILDKTEEIMLDPNYRLPEVIL